MRVLPLTQLTSKYKLKRMKSKVVTLIIGILCMFLGAALLFKAHERPQMIWGMAGVVWGFWMITYELVKLLGTMHVYRFLHYYEHHDHLMNETYILSELTRDQVTQLKEFDPDLFKNKPIMVDTIQPIGLDLEGKSKVLGWIYAHNQAEARRTLHYTEDFNQYMYSEKGAPFDEDLQAIYGNDEESDFITDLL